MNVLFLDIDGVLNRNGTKERCCGFMGVDRELSKRFLAWLKDTDVNIVLSSTWRRHPEMWEHLHESGIDWTGMTPVLGTNVRGDEIQHWLDKNEGSWTSYAILDDDSDMLDHQRERFVRTHTALGLQDEHIEKLSALFSKV